MTLPPAGDVLVLGLGRSGEAAARYLAARPGLRVTAVDGKTGADLERRAGTLRVIGVDVRLGVSDVAGDFTLVVASPGIPPHAPLMTSAKALGVPVVSELELAYREARGRFAAVTGTNGKTTVTSLLAHIVDEAGLPERTIGNIGCPAISAVEGAGDDVTFIAEVSSFQLALTFDFHPRVSVLLNVTPDHLDWHGTMEAYAADKARVFANQGPGDTAVVDVDDAGSAPYADEVAARGVHVVRVSRELLAPGGAALVDGHLTLDVPSGPLALVHVSELRIKGSHNVGNALAAAAAAHALGVPAEAIRAGLRSFEPIEHRLEPVEWVRGVEYFNDSKATNPDAVLKALTAFEERPLVVLLGGLNKGNDFRPLARAVAARCKAAVVFGKSRAELVAAFASAGARPGGAQVEEASGMLEALHTAARLAEEGDAVLLSPACASFDEFASYEHRGRVFKEAVAAMASEGDR